MQKEEWTQLDALEAVERRKLEKAELYKELERTKEPKKGIVIISRLKYL